MVYWLNSIFLFITIIIMTLKLQEFIEIIWGYYHANKRQFTWRTNPSPYQVLISEIMLQQTQTFRVAPKFELFMQELPTIEALATAPFAQILALWKGLGYNRRARYLQETAQRIVSEHGGIVPCDPRILETFPGIGYATARSIVAFAYNIPTVFIETNIRAVFIKHFFPEQEKITDKQLMPLITETVDRENPREWYYALMDYGVKLKAEHKNPSRASAHHTQQSKFQGSNRQIRGKILEHLLMHRVLSFEQLYTVLVEDPVMSFINESKVEKALGQLCRDRLVVEQVSGRYTVPSY